MKKGYTDITLVLDRSGSMATVAQGTIGGVNTFIEEQKKVPGEATFTLARFDHEHDIVHDGKAMKDVPPIDSEVFAPRGNTALFDAIGRTIIRTGERLAKMAEKDRPEHVIFAIVTDGWENASREWTQQRVADAIKLQREKYSWEFIYIGANQDAFCNARAMNIAGANAINYTNNHAGTQVLYRSVSSNTSKLRMGCKLDMSFEPEDIAAQASAKLQP